MQLPSVNVTQKKKLIERFKQNKITESVSYAVANRVLAGMEIVDVVTYQDYFLEFKCITNTEEGLLPFELAVI